MSNEEFTEQPAPTWHQANRGRIERVRTVRRRRNRAWVDSLKAGPCMDCGDRFPPYVMDWDHRDPQTKRRDVTRLVMQGCSKPRIAAEIALCDLVCANCHRERTYGRAVHASA